MVRLSITSAINRGGRLHLLQEGRERATGRECAGASRAGEKLRGKSCYSVLTGVQNKRDLSPPFSPPCRAGVMAEAAVTGVSGEAMAAAAAEGSAGPAGLSLGRGFSSYRPFEPQALGLSPSWRLTGFSGMKG